VFDRTLITNYVRFFLYVYVHVKVKGTLVCGARYEGQFENDVKHGVGVFGMKRRARFCATKVCCFFMDFKEYIITKLNQIFGKVPNPSLYSYLWMNRLNYILISFV